MADWTQALSAFAISVLPPQIFFFAGILSSSSSYSKPPQRVVRVAWFCSRPAMQAANRSHPTTLVEYESEDDVFPISVLLSSN
jgi:hypothetical protein